MAKRNILRILHSPPGGVSERFGCDKTATRLCSGSLNEWQIETNGCSVPAEGSGTVTGSAGPQKSAAQVFAFSKILMVTAVAIARLSVVAI